MAEESRQEEPRRESEAVRTLDRLASALKRAQDGGRPASAKLSRLRGG